MGPAALPHLVRLIGHPDKYVRRNAVWALGKLYEDKPDAALSKSFVSRLSDLDPNNPELIHVRRMAAISLGRMKATDSIKALEVFYDMERTSLHVGGGCP